MLKAKTRYDVQCGKSAVSRAGRLAGLALLSIALVSSCSSHAAQPISPALPPSADVLAQMEKVANWQLPRVEYLDYLAYKLSLIHI